MTAIDAAATTIPAGTYMDVDRSTPPSAFAVKHMVVSTFRGRFEDFDADARRRRGRQRRLDGVVKADTIVVKDENLAAHLKSPEFFDTERLPRDHVRVLEGRPRRRRT